MNKEKLESIITHNTFKGSDKFYFKNPPVVGTVNGFDAKVVFYYSHYKEYLVFAIAWVNPKQKYAFHYLADYNMLPIHLYDYQTLADSGEFVPAQDVVDIVPNYMELVWDATKEKDNIKHNKYYGNLYDEEHKLQYYFQKQYEDKNIDRYSPEIYIKNFKKRLKCNEYDLLLSRYINLKPYLKGEKEFKKRKKFTKKQILKDLEDSKKKNELMVDILKNI
jgi:hypothetical protein